MDELPQGFDVERGEQTDVRAQGFRDRLRLPMDFTDNTAQCAVPDLAVDRNE